MTPPIFMTQQQVRELLDLVRRDLDLWQMLKDREVEGERIYAIARSQGKWPDLDADTLPPRMRPSLDELMVEFLVRQYGADYHCYSRASLTMAIRKELRIELGMPI